MCNLGILLKEVPLHGDSETRVPLQGDSETCVGSLNHSEEGLPLFREEMEYFSLLLFVGGHCLQKQEGFLPQGIQSSVFTKYLGIYGVKTSISLLSLTTFC